MSQGLWHVIEELMDKAAAAGTGGSASQSASASAGGGSALPGALGASSSSSTGTVSSAAKASATDLADKKKVAEWSKADMQARGYIRTRCSATISDKLRPEVCAYDMWALLEFEYGQVGLTGAFTEFKKALAVTIPNNANPSAAIDKIGQHFRRLHSLGVEVPEFIHGMLIVSKLPEYMNLVAQMAAQAKGISSISPNAIRAAALNAWENKTTKGKSNGNVNGNGNGGDANKLTAVKRNQGNRSFNGQQQGNQQQQRGQGSGQGQQQQQQDSQQQKKKRARGARKPKGKNAAGAVDDGDNLESLVSNVIINDPIPPQKVLHGKEVTLSLKSNLAPAPRKPSKTYPSITRATRLAKEIGVKGTPEAVRLLEKLVDSGRVRDPPLSARIQEVDNMYDSLPDETPLSTGEGEDDEYDDEEDERAAKRFKLTPLRDRIDTRFDNEAFAREPTPDGTSFGEDESVDNAIAEAAGMEVDQESVPLFHTEPQCTHHFPTADAERDAHPKICGFLDNWLTCTDGSIVPINDDLCKHSLDYALCGKCKGKSTVDQRVQTSNWLLDSGASQTYTMDKLDFVEFTPSTSPDVLRTANSVAFCRGYGTVLLKSVSLDGKPTTIRLGNVGYVPDLRMRLISLGAILKRGMVCRGNAHQISIFDEGSGAHYMTCIRAAHKAHNMYYLAQPGEKVMAAPLQSVYALDYDTMHRRMGHPSDDVLRHMRKGTDGFPPELNIPSDHPPCRGCAMGKTPQRTFPPLEQRAKTPFELIYSDLKELPTTSYSKFKHVVVFIDDYSSYAWIYRLRQKSDALQALKEFLAMVETQFNAKVKQWLSDQGGELIGNLNLSPTEFRKLLESKGICVRGSAPNAHGQNGRAERFIRTMMEKSEALRHQACIPQSWWEFSIKHAVYLYNRSPVRRLDWQTPYSVLKSKPPRIDKLRVFGCGAYVFIPEEIRKNKQAPCAELMTYLGVAPGGMGNYLFMRSPNVVLFTAAQALFDEYLFPRCPKSVESRHRPTVLNRRYTPPLEDSTELDDDDGPAPPSHSHHEPPAKGQDPSARRCRGAA